MIDPDELAMRAACRAAPDDDLPRLAFADWLDDHGRAELAELIRVQCNIADYYRQRECKFECKGEGPPGPVWCSQCGHDPKCCTCDSSGDLWPLRQRQNALIPAVESALPIRTRRAVEAARSSVHGCCSRHADNMRCDCLDRAADVTFDRGFAAVRCRLAEWVELCDKCGGYGNVHACGECEGEFIGIGPLVAAVVQVGRVEMTDRGTHCNNFDSFMFSAVSEVEDLPNLPRNCRVGPALVEILRKNPNKRHDSLSWVSFSNEEIAHDALSVACIEFAEHSTVPARSDHPQGA